MSEEGFVLVPSPPACATLTIRFFTVMGEGAWFFGPSVVPRQLLPTSSWWAKRRGGSCLWTELDFSGIMFTPWQSTTPVHSLLIMYFWVWRWTGRTLPKSQVAQVSLLQRESEFKEKKSLLLHITPWNKGEKFPMILKAWYARKRIVSSRFS